MIAAALLATGCGGTPTASTPATASPTGSSTGTPSASTSPTSAPTASASPSHSPSSAAPSSRTSAQLRKALLGLKDVPAGFELSPAAEDDHSKASSSRAACAPLVRLLNEDKTAGSLATAAVSFGGGEDGPALDETIDAVSSVSAATRSVDGYRKAVRNCDAITYKVPGVGTSTVHARAISFDDMGDGSFAARFSATSGALDGFEVIQVGVRTDDVVLGLSFFWTDPGDAEDGASVALDKAQGILGTGGSNG